MRALIGTLAIAGLLACDPPPPSYAQYRYGPDSTSSQPTPMAAPVAPPPGYTTTQVQPGYTTTQIQPIAPPAPVGPTTQGSYTTTQIQPIAPPAPAPGPPPPAPGPEVYGPPPPPSSGGALAAGDYACWQVGMGGYVASNLVSVTLGTDGSYRVAGYNGGGGTFRADSVTIYLSGGPLNGWVGAVGANAKGPLVRFRPDVPNNPGAEMHQGDHLCFLHF